MSSLSNELVHEPLHQLTIWLSKVSKSWTWVCPPIYRCLVFCNGNISIWTHLIGEYPVYQSMIPIFRLVLELFSDSLTIRACWDYKESTESAGHPIQNIHGDQKHEQFQILECIHHRFHQVLWEVLQNQNASVVGIEIFEKYQ